MPESSPPPPADGDPGAGPPASGPVADLARRLRDAAALKTAGEVLAWDEQDVPAVGPPRTSGRTSSPPWPGSLTTG